jgi:hypothetical protein
MGRWLVGWVQGKCVYCDASVPAESLVPNLAIRAAVHAFKQEDHVCEFTLMKAGKRRREEPEEELPLEEGSDQKRQARVRKPFAYLYAALCGLVILLVVPNTFASSTELLSLFSKQSSQ